MKKIIFFLTLYTLVTPYNLFSQWHKQTVPVNKPITGIKFVDTLNGWACTSYGTQLDTAYILHTTNGGLNWYVQYKTWNSTYNAISVIDNNYIYAGGDSAATAKLSKTTNGGLNWIDMPTPINMSINDMVFLNKDSGWTCTGIFGPDVRTTTNGGLIWIVRTNGINNLTHRIFYLNYNTGFCGADFNLYKTTDAGLNWNLLNTFSQSVESVFFLNENTGWTGLNLNRMYHTTNGGINWIFQNVPSSNNNIYDIFFLNSSTGYAGTGLNKIFKTTDGGSNWGFQSDTGGSYRLSIIDSLHGWSCWIGTIIGICNTTNGGGQITYVGIKKISNKIPEQYKLFQNYPNPFNPKTNIRFSLIKPSYVQLKIYDVSGKEITIWESEKELSTGTHEIQFNASGLASGVYFYQLIITNEKSEEVYIETKKMIFLK